MSSLYYANALFSKYPAASSVFATGAFPEQTSCAFAANPPRPGYGAGSGASFAAAVPGLYPGGGGLAGQPGAAGVYAAGYGLEPGSFNMHCAPFEQSLSGVCPGDPAKAPGAKEPRDADLAADSNFRIYPWMRSSGNATHRAAPSRPEPQGPRRLPRRAPPARPSAPFRVHGAPPAGGGPWGRGTPFLGRAIRRAASTPGLLGALRLALLPGGALSASGPALGSPRSPPTLPPSLLALNIYQPRPQRPGKRPFVLRRKARVCRE